MSVDVDVDVETVGYNPIFVDVDVDVVEAKPILVAMLNLVEVYDTPDGLEYWHGNRCLPFYTCAYDKHGKVTHEGYLIAATRYLRDFEDKTSGEAVDGVLLGRLRSVQVRVSQDGICQMSYWHKGLQLPQKSKIVLGLTDE